MNPYGAPPSGQYGGGGQYNDYNQHTGTYGVSDSQCCMHPMQFNSLISLLSSLLSLLSGASAAVRAAAGRVAE